MRDEESARILTRRTAYNGKILDLEIEQIELPGGKRTDFELVRHPGAAAVVMMSEEREVVMLRHYRHATGGWLSEIPAGKLDPGEEPAACARRECGEETGLEPRDLTPLGWIWTTPGFSNEKVWLFLGRNLSAVEPRLDGTEVLRTERVPFDQAVSIARSGELTDAKSICALLRAAALV